VHLSGAELEVRLTRVPRRHPWKGVSDVYNYWIDEGKDFPEPMALSVAPRIFGPAHAQRTRQGKAERVALKLTCVQCGENAVERFGDGFVLCDICEVAPAMEPWQIDFNKLLALASSNRKDDGFQDAENYKRKQPESVPVSLPELYSHADRPLLDYELALLLAVKYPKFTQRNSPAYLKAQRAAAQLAAHFLFQRTFAEITHMIPQTTEDAVRKFCRRAHADFAKYLRSCQGRIPEEAVAALRSGMLTSLFAPALVKGHQCHSQTYCTA
jgi:ribosomal protein L37AE/L43A